MEKNSKSVSDSKKTKKAYTKPEMTLLGTVNKITEGMGSSSNEGCEATS